MSRFEHNIRRHGREVPVYKDTKTGETDFGESITEFSQTGTVYCLRSYQNRNELRNSETGTYDTDNPVFFFPPDADVSTGDRIEYQGQLYELSGYTGYSTHLAIFGQPVQQ